VQGIAEIVFQGACLLLPGLRIVEPARVVRDVRPGSDEGHAREQGIDVALQFRQPLQVTRDPVLSQTAARSAELQEHGPQQLEVIVELELAKVRDLTNLPKQGHVLA
jgi:hypothetical protein